MNVKKVLVHKYLRLIICSMEGINPKGCDALRRVFQRKTKPAFTQISVKNTENIK